MKKIITLVCIVCVFNANSQVSFGVRTGLALANTFGHSYDNPTFRTGFYGGIYLHVPVHKNLSFEPGILFCQKGDNSNIYIRDAYSVQFTYRKKETENYIEVPLLANVRIAPKWNILFGPQVSFLVSANSLDNFGPTRVDIYNEIQHTMVGLISGIGYHLWKRIGFTLQYDVDLTVHTESYSDVRHQVIQLGMDFRL